MGIKILDAGSDVGALTLQGFGPCRAYEYRQQGGLGIGIYHELETSPYQAGRISGPSRSSLKAPRRGLLVR